MGLRKSPKARARRALINNRKKVLRNVDLINALATIGIHFKPMH